MSLTKALHRAIQVDLIEEVQRLVTDGANIDHVLGMRGTALCAAIECRNLEIARFLILSGCDVNAQDYDGEPPLLLALRKNKPGHIKGRNPCLDIAQELIKHPKCNTNKVDPLTKKSAIHFATEEGMLVVVGWLINSANKCDINAQDLNENSPLHLAVLNGKHDVVEILIANSKCRYKVYNKAGQTPLHICTNNGDSKSLNMLLKQLAGKIKTVSHLSGDTCEYDIDSELSINVNAVTMFEKETCLHLACRNGHDVIVSALVEHGAQVNLKNNKNNTPLLLAIGSVNQWQTMSNVVPRILLKSGANPNVKSSVFCRYYPSNIDATPLILAAKNDNTELARMLLKNGADVNMTDNIGQTPLYIALWENCTRVASVFLNECPDININIQTELGSTCMHAVIKYRVWNHDNDNVIREMIDALTAAGGICLPDINGKTPIDWAIDYENIIALDAFLEKFSDSQTDGSVLSKQFDVAIAENNVEFARALLTHGIEIDYNNKTESNLSVALYFSSYDIARFLVQNGCDLRKESYIFADFVDPADDTGSSDDESGCSDDSITYKFSDMYKGRLDMFRGNDELRSWVRDKASTPASLQLSCKVSIRKLFLSNNIPFKKINDLSLPKKLINKLRYRDS